MTKAIKYLSYKEFLVLTVPFMISTATQPLLGAVNTAIMGHLSDAAYIAAVALGVILFNSMYWLFGFLRVATTGFSAQALGKGDREAVSLALYRPALLAAGISIFCILIYTVLFPAYATFMKAEGRVLFFLKQYCDVLIWGAPFVLGNYVILGWLMGQMLVRLTLWMQISMNVLNMILSFVFVFYGGWGVAGVAWGTLLAQMYGFVVGLFILACVRERLTRSVVIIRRVFHGKALLQIMKVNGDLMIRTVCLLTINNLFANTGSAMGTTILAANAVLLEIIFIMAYFFDGIANGVSVFSGRAKGEGHLGLWKDTIRIGLGCAGVMVIMWELLLVSGGHVLIEAMTNVVAVKMVAKDYRWVLQVYPICAAVGLVLYGMYTGCGETAWVRNMMLIAVIVFFMGDWQLTKYWGNTGLWITYAGTYFLESVLLVIFLRYIHIFPQRDGEYDRSG